MTVNPVDMQVILPQTGQVNRISRGLQFQQQVEQQILGQQIQKEMRDQEHQVQKTTNIKHNRIDNGRKEQKKGSQHNKSKHKSTHQEQEDTIESEVTVKSSIGSVLDIKI